VVFIGLFLWFALSLMWQVAMIMVLHFGAFISLPLGYLIS
jgi:hypothetical protein